MIAIPLLVWYSIVKNKDVPSNGLVYPLGNVFFRIYARVGNVRSRPAPQEITGRSKKRMENFTERKAPAGLYDPRFEHDNCGIGAVVDIKGRKTHKTIDDALQIVEHLEHRAGKDAEGKPAMVSVSCCRSATSSSKKLPKKPALRWATSVTTALACSFSHRKS
mgnify:CR=1 FL=1